MTVSELMDKLKDCAPNAAVRLAYEDLPLDCVISDGEEVTLS